MLPVSGKAPAAVLGRRQYVRNSDIVISASVRKNVEVHP
jgi:hypothetical protein